MLAAAPRWQAPEKPQVVTIAEGTTQQWTHVQVRKARLENRNPNVNSRRAMARLGAEDLW